MNLSSLEYLERKPILKWENHKEMKANENVDLFGFQRFHYYQWHVNSFLVRILLQRLPL